MGWLLRDGGGVIPTMLRIEDEVFDLGGFASLEETLDEHGECEVEHEVAWICEVLKMGTIAWVHIRGLNTLVGVL